MLKIPETLGEFLNDDFVIVQIDLLWRRDVECWQHPQLDEIFEEDPPETRIYDGCDSDYFRIWFRNKEKETLHVIVKSSVLSSCETDEWPNELVDYVHSSVTVALLEDTWSPDGEQFCFTKRGKAISRFFGRKGEYSMEVSPDIAGFKEADGSFHFDS